MEYQVISTLPTITSNATKLSCYQFYDELSDGLDYQKASRDVVVEIFTDKGCTNKVASWNQDSGMFTVSYSQDDRTMTVAMTDSGLAAINGATENVNGKLYIGYSNYTMRMTYTARINSAKALTLGENGNENKIVLTWKRTSSAYYDTLVDDCHVYCFGVDITKTFSDKTQEAAARADLFTHVKFKIYNATDGYYVKAERSEENGVYYMTGRTASETDATTFYPMT